LNFLPVPGRLAPSAAGVLLLLTGLLLAATLLAGFLPGLLVLLTRILILIAHSEFSLCIVSSGDQRLPARLVAMEQRFRMITYVPLIVCELTGNLGPSGNL
jgi:hypothetical protein